MTAQEVDRRERFTTLKRVVADRQAQVIDMAKHAVARSEGNPGGVGHYMDALREALLGLRQAEDALVEFCEAEQSVFKAGK